MQGDRRPWFQLQEHPAPIPLRIVDRASDGNWRQQTRREWKQPFDPDRPLIRVTWLRGAEVSELLLVCHHCICDGRSIITLLHEILQLCSRPERDIGTHASLQSIEELLPEVVRNDARLRRRIRWKAALFKLFIRSRRPGPARTYGEVYATGWTLDRATTQALAQRCRAEGVTLFNAVCVAFVLGFRAVRGARGVGRFVVPVDVRRFLPALAADSLFAMAPTIALSLRTPHRGNMSDAAFWALARALKVDMDHKIGRLGPRVQQNLLGMEHLHALFDRLIAYGQSRPSGGNVTLSWLGRLDLAQDYRDFRLEAIHSPTAMLAPTPATLVTITGFDGALDFALTSDAQSLHIAEAEAVEGRVVAILRTAARSADAKTRNTDVAARPRGTDPAAPPREASAHSAPEVGP